MGWELPGLTTLSLSVGLRSVEASSPHSFRGAHSSRGEDGIRPVDGSAHLGLFQRRANEASETAYYDAGAEADALGAERGQSLLEGGPLTGRCDVAVSRPWICKDWACWIEGMHTVRSPNEDALEDLRPRLGVAWRLPAETRQELTGAVAEILMEAPFFGPRRHRWVSSVLKSVLSVM